MKKNKIINQFLMTIILIFVLMVFMLCYIFSSFYKSSVSNIQELGVSNMNSQATMIENYLNKGINVLWVSADSVDYMLESGADTDAILQYLTEETERMKAQVDPNFTGIYGYIAGKYLDGIGWVPPEDYDPKQREWYIKAVEAGGRATIVAPYLDAQTGTIMISVSQLLSDGESVVSLDIALNEVQEITKGMTMNDKGYGFILDRTGLVVAHFNEEEKGKVYPQNEEQQAMLSRIFAGTSEKFEMKLNGDRCTVFSKQIAGDWNVVIVASNTKLFYDLRNQMLVGVLSAVAIFLVIVVFCLISVRRIRKYQRKEHKSREKLDRMNMNIIRSLAYTIDAKDDYTSGHSQRVAEYALAIAKRMGKSEEDQKVIYYAGLLHDVGKIRVSELVINKPGKLTEDEFDQIRVHPVRGYQILKDIHEDERIEYGAKYHHERYDGKGYPNGLAGDNIPEIARIIGVADAYDAMASNRSYRDALPQDVVRREIEEGRGRQFDPKIADIMLEMIDEDKEYKMCQSEKKQKNVLVVDDELMNIKMVKHILKDIPAVRVIGASTKEETCKALKEEDVALILLDLKMPDTDGFELYQLIREKYDTPVVLMTSDRSIETIQKISELGLDDYLTKPLNAYVTRETVHGMIQG